jgi:uncharacterized protein with PQ loop repeat
MGHLIDLVAGGWGIIMGAAPLLQTRRMIKRKHSGDVSQAMFATLVIGALLWLVYGVVHDLPSIIVANVAGMVASTTALIVAVRYRNGDDHIPE